MGSWSSREKRGHGNGERGRGKRGHGNGERGRGKRGRESEEEGPEAKRARKEGDPPATDPPSPACRLFTRILRVYIRACEAKGASPLSEDPFADTEAPDVIMAIESILRCQVYLGVLSDVVRNIGEASGIIHRCDCGQLMVIAFQRSVQTCPDCGKEWCNYHKNGSDSCWVPKREECSWWWTCPCIMSDQSNHEKLGIAIGRIGGAVVGECSS